MTRRVFIPPWDPRTAKGRPAHDRVADIVADWFVYRYEPLALVTLEKMLTHWLRGSVREAASEAERQGLVDWGDGEESLRPTLRRLASLVSAARDYSERLEEKMTEA